MDAMANITAAAAVLVLVRLRDVAMGDGVIGFEGMVDLMDKQCWSAMVCFVVIDYDDDDVMWTWS